ncbi:MAG TPA: MmcQ/YjbR family DNA-binding protein [Candidatus Sulfotelmatobacter sp.]|nr:MmcQ/YjbR family DNA-binding protein [Candidatus Sulfotelmatobacter sp.]
MSGTIGAPNGIAYSVPLRILSSQSPTSIDCRAVVRGVTIIAGGHVNVDDFRRIALSLEGAEESSHMGQPDFRVGGRIFATLASAAQGYGNLKLTPEQQAAFVEELPNVFLPVPGGWGRMGATHIRLAAASEDVLAGALRTAWKLRVDKNAKSGSKSRSKSRTKSRTKKRSPDSR